MFFWGCRMRVKFFVLVLFLCVSYVSAVHTVDDFYVQASQNAQDIAALKQEIASLKQGFDDSIRSIGFKVVLWFAFTFIALECARYLAGIVERYRNRKQLQRERDHYVLQLKESDQLLREHDRLILSINSLLQENTRRLNLLLGEEFSVPHFDGRFILPMIALMVGGCAIIIVNQDIAGFGIFLLGISLLIVSLLAYVVSFRRVVFVDRNVPLVEDAKVEKEIKKRVGGL